MRILINQQTVRVYPSKITHGKTSAMFTFCVQTVFLQPHKLKVSFATLQGLCRWCADPAYPIRPQCVLVARGRPWFWPCTPVLVACPRSYSSVGLSENIVAVRKIRSEHSDIIFSLKLTKKIGKVVERKQRVYIMFSFVSIYDDVIIWEC